jgi:hypothetical protein
LAAFGGSFSSQEISTSIVSLRGGGAGRFVGTGGAGRFDGAAAGGRFDGAAAGGRFDGEGDAGRLEGDLAGGFDCLPDGEDAIFSPIVCQRGPRKYSSSSAKS